MSSMNFAQEDSTNGKSYNENVTVPCFDLHMGAGTINFIVGGEHEER